MFQNYFKTAKLFTGLLIPSKLFYLPIACLFIPKAQWHKDIILIFLLEIQQRLLNRDVSVFQVCSDTNSEVVMSSKIVKTHDYRSAT